MDSSICSALKHLRVKPMFLESFSLYVTIPPQQGSVETYSCASFFKFMGITNRTGLKCRHPGLIHKDCDGFYSPGNEPTWP